MNKLLLVMAAAFVLVYGAVYAMGRAGREAKDMGKGWTAGKVDIFDYKTGKALTVDKIVKSEEEYEKQLSADVCMIVRKGGTEAPFTGALLNEHRTGVFKCVVCGTGLFLSGTKFESGTGWPSFFQPVSKSNIVEETDTSHGMIRTEVRCARCGAHLGHVFNDGPAPAGLRYCINSKALVFEEIK